MYSFFRLAKVLSFVILLSFLVNNSLFAQFYSLKGKISDSETDLPLMYANIRVLSSSIGTSANRNGEFELRLPKGNHIIVASFLGYISDTLNVNITSNLNHNFSLKPSYINLAEITVLPTENPANEIIRKAIARKQVRNERLNSYSFTAYTKGVIKSDKEVSATSNTLSLNANLDSAELKINAIIENQSFALFKKPSSYKEYIIARKQTANLPSSFNIITGGRMIQNFYSDDISFMNQNMKAPLADDALDYYYFNIEDTISIDNENIFVISITPDDEDDPGFVGLIYISGKSFDLRQVNLSLNRAANVGGILDTIAIYQQFFAFEDSVLKSEMITDPFVFMPVDYHILVSAKILNLIKFEFDLNTILYDYKINSHIDENSFDMALITVKTDADKKDSLFWEGIQRISNTDEEKTAYTKIDSISSIPFSFADDFSWLSSRIRFSPDFSISAPLSMYHFNRVEGHSLDFSIAYRRYNEDRGDSRLGFSYGFNDKKFKYDFRTKYLLGDYRTYSVSLNVFNKTKKLFEEDLEYSDFLSTLLSIIDKYDFNDYYYSNGFNVSLSGEVFPLLKLNLGFMNRTDKSGVKTSDFSIFSSEKQYKENQTIFDTRINLIEAGFRLDFRKYVEDGQFRRRINNRSFNFFVDGNVQFSDKSIFNSSLDFITYDLKLTGNFNLYRNIDVNLSVDGFYTTGTLPYQMLKSIPGNIDLIAREKTIRTLDFNSGFGDRLVSAFCDIDLQDELFKFSGIDFLKKLELTTSVFINSAFSDISPKSSSILPVKIITYKNPLTEVGFSIGHVLFPIRFSFAWRLNHKDEGDFRFGLSTLIID